MQKIIEKATQIKCLICDIDGVLTDGSLYMDNYGNELKNFNVQDGMGLKLLMAADIKVAVITTSQNKVIDHRMKQLGIKCYFKGCVNKAGAFKTLKEELNLNNADLAYIGDDLPDLPLIREVGLGIAVANAVPQVKEVALWQTTKTGGHGAVREVCDLILYAQEKNQLAITKYLANECH